MWELSEQSPSRLFSASASRRSPCNPWLLMGQCRYARPALHGARAVNHPAHARRLLCVWGGEASAFPLA